MEVVVGRAEVVDVVRLALHNTVVLDADLVVPAAHLLGLGFGGWGVGVGVMVGVGVGVGVGVRVRARVRVRVRVGVRVRVPALGLWWVHPCIHG